MSVGYGRPSTPKSSRKNEPRSSGTSIVIDQEVSVISSDAVEAKLTDKRASISASQLDSYDKHQYGGQNSSFAAASQPSLHRRVSVTSDVAPTHDEVSRKLDRFAADIDGMRALSLFLKTKEPPPGNYMSYPFLDSNTLHGLQGKKRIFKGLKRRKQARKGSKQKLLCLPDSAVSARTTKGSRHIAISIPIEFDYPELMLPSQKEKLLDSRQTKHKTVTVNKPPGALSPVTEASESQSPHSNDPKSEDEKLETTKSSSDRGLDDVAALLGSENARVLGEYYSLSNTTEVRRYAKKAPQTYIDTNRAQRSYVTISPDRSPDLNVNRMTHLSDDLRHSGGTVYSTMTIDSGDYRSRGPSTVETAPTINTNVPSRPPRTSTSSNPFVRGHAHTQSLDAAIESNLEDAPRVSMYSDRTGSCISGGPMTPVTYGTAEIARGYTPKLPHAQDGSFEKLPGGRPESPCVPDYMPLPSPRRSDVASERKPTPQTPESERFDGYAAASPQSRRERVKAKKARDIAAAQGFRSSVGSETTRSHRLRRSSSPGNLRNIVQDFLRREDNRTISDIMLVAESRPTDPLPDFDLVITTPGKTPHNQFSHDAIRYMDHPTHIYQPHQRLSSPPDSDSSLSPLSPQETWNISLAGVPRSGKKDLKNQPTNRHRHHALALREKNIEERLCRLEQDNEILLHTLGDMAQSFAGLSVLLGEGKGRTEHDDDEDDGEDLGWEERSLEPIMRELQSAAGKVEGEIADSRERLYLDNMGVIS